MFEPIEAPDVHRGPATGHTSEHGTTWKDAVSRINDAFEELFRRGEEAVSPSTGVTAEFASYLNERFEAAEAKIAFYEDALSEALFKIESHETSIRMLSTPAEPAPQAPDGVPASAGTPETDADPTNPNVVVPPANVPPAV